MNRKPKMMMALIVPALLFLTLGCSVRPLTDEEAMELYRKAESSRSKIENETTDSNKDRTRHHPENLSEAPKPLGPPAISSARRLNEDQLKILVRWALKELNKANQPFCWRNSYGRGVGVPVSTCPEGQEKDAWLCYPSCESKGKKGWKGVGPVCWQPCPAGFRDDGMYCFKPKPYGRGVGFPWKFGDPPFNLRNAKKRCERKHGKGKCEKWGAIYYPKCRSGYRNVGCCVCSPRCPSGMTDIGISCQKGSKGRGVGKPMHCKGSQEYDAGLCYKRCENNYHGVGPVCWQDCPDTQAHGCGAGCAADSSQCVEQTVSQVLSPLELAINLAGAVTTGGSANVAVKAAKTSAKTAARTASKTGRAVAKSTVKQSIKTIANEMIDKIRAKLTRKLIKKYSMEVAEEVCWNAAESLAGAVLAQDFDTKDFLMSLDPTGIADVVEVFNKPKCGFDEDPPKLRISQKN